jgi:hypothetical protein
MFLNAIEAYRNWNPGEPEPTVELEVNYEPRSISLSQACGLMWPCNDIVPNIYFSMAVEGCSVDRIDIKRQTYSACAQAMLQCIRKEFAKTS